MGYGCDICGENVPTTPVSFSHNVGMLFMRSTETTEGGLCSPCMWKTFRRHMLLNATLGWWGFISFFATLYYFVKNLTEVSRGRADLGPILERHDRARREREEERERTDPATALGPFQHTVRMRLERGEDVARIVADMAEVANVSVEDARAFVEQQAAHPDGTNLGCA